MRTGWIEIGALALAGLLAVAAARGWPGASWLRVVGRRLREWAWANPATAVLWLIVALHAWMLAGLPPGLRAAVLRTHSTNLVQMRRDPLSVLFSSAIWTELPDLIFVTVAAVLVLGPAERWLGSARMVMVYVTGHVLASVLMVMWLGKAVRIGLVSHADAVGVDVGVSFGTYCVAGVLCYRLSGWWTPAAIVAVGGYLWVAQIYDHSTGGLGHLTAFVLGLLLYPVTRSARVHARQSGRWIRVPVYPEGVTQPPVPAPVS